MSNPLIDGTQGNNANILKQFMEFKKQMQNQNPRDMLNQLISSGKVSQEQYNQALNMANQFKDILK